MSRDNSSVVALHLAALVQPLFGNHSSVKCVVNEHGDTVFVKDVALLLQLLDIEHPVGQLIVSVCADHSNGHGTGVKSLIVMLGQLTEAYIMLQEQGVPGSVIIKLLRTIMKDCMNKLTELQIPVSITLQEQPKEQISPEQKCLEFPPRHTQEQKCLEFPPRHTQEQKCLTHETDSGFFEAHMSSNDKTRQDTLSSQSIDLSTQHTTLKDLENRREAVSETRYVHLKMKEKHEDEDEDDIDWFFDRSVPELDVGNNSTACVSNKQTHLEKTEASDLISSLQDTDQHDSDFDDCFDEGLTKQNIKLTVVTHSDSNPGKQTLELDLFPKPLITDTSQLDDILLENHSALESKVAEVSDNSDVNTKDITEDDFGSCFEDFDPEDEIRSETKGHKKENSGESHVVLQLTEAKGILKNADKSMIYSSSTSRHLKADSSSPVTCIPDLQSRVTTDNEMAQDRKHQNATKGTEMVDVPCDVSEITRLNKMLQEVKERKNILSSPSGAVRTGKGDTVSKSIALNLENVNDMPVQIKKRVSREKSVLNSSRHFKTFDSTIAEMKEADCSEDSSRCTSDFEKRLQQKLAEKKRQSVGASLSHSRHFKSLDSLTILGTQSDRKTSETDPSTLSDSENEIVQSHTVPLAEVLDNERASHTALPGGVSTLCDKVTASSGRDSVCDAAPSPSPRPGPSAGSSGIRLGLSLPEAAQGLCHGCEDSMELVLQVAETQMMYTGYKRFNIKLVHTHSVAGPPQSETTLVPGLVLECNMETVSYFTSNKHWNILLVNGDLSSTYHHHGYKMAAKGSLVIGPESLTSHVSQDQWLLECTEILQQLSVDLMLVRGTADDKVKETLLSVGIVTLEKIPYSVLGAVREITRTELTVYVTDCNKSHVCEGVTVRPYMSDWCDKMTRKDTTLVVIDTPAPSVWQTLVLCHPSPLALDVLEQKVQACSHRLASALHDGIVLPGGGATEKFCSQYLLEICNKKQDVTSDLDLYQPVVMEALAEVFNKIVSLVETNTSKMVKYDSQQATFDTGPDSSTVYCNYNVSRSAHINTLKDKETNVMHSCLSSQTQYCNVQTQHCNVQTQYCNIVDCPYVLTRNSETRVFDNYKSKMAAWSAALDTVALVTQTDAHIVTGVTSDDVKNASVYINGVIL